MKFDQVQKRTRKQKARDYDLKSYKRIFTVPLSEFGW